MKIKQSKKEKMERKKIYIRGSRIPSPSKMEFFENSEKRM